MIVFFVVAGVVVVVVVVTDERRSDDDDFGRFSDGGRDEVPVVHGTKNENVSQVLSRNVECVGALKTTKNH